MSIEKIYGINIEIPEPNGYIETWGTDNPKEQYWRRIPLPSFFDLVEYNKEGDVLLTKQQEDYAREEVRRCKEGFFFMSNGKVKYVTGKNYFYLKFWKLEDDIYPDYRDLDRRYFTYLNHWENVSWCLGVVIGKKLGQGVHGSLVGGE